MEYWHVWVIVGVILLIAELLASGFVLGIFGIACFISAILAGIGLSFNIQLAGFAIASAIAAFTIRPLIIKYCYSTNQNVKTNVDALIGMTGIVIETIDRLSNTGRVKLGGEDWKAASENERIIEVGRKVKIQQINGCKVIVVPDNGIEQGVMK